MSIKHPVQKIHNTYFEACRNLLKIFFKIYLKYVAFRLVSLSLLAYLSTRLEFNMINIIINSWKINL